MFQLLQQQQNLLDIAALILRIFSDLFNATRAMMTIAFLLVIMATVLLFVYVFFDSARIQGLAMICMWLCFAMGKTTDMG